MKVREFAYRSIQHSVVLIQFTEVAVTMKVALSTLTLVRELLKQTIQCGVRDSTRLLVKQKLLDIM